jgi:hypothetical protein
MVMRCPVYRLHLQHWQQQQQPAAPIHACCDNKKFNSAALRSLIALHQCGAAAAAASINIKQLLLWHISCQQQQQPLLQGWSS